MGKTMRTIWNDLLHLFFPKLCTICRNPLLQSENQFCLHCLCDLPRTGYIFNEDNPAAQLFFGKTKVEQATAFLHFLDGSKVQQMIYSIKYYGNEEAGYLAGKIAAGELFNSSIHSFDILIPVPLHPKREKERGYNQSEAIARGISEITGKPVMTSLLIRTGHKAPQVFQSSYERWSNTQNLFELREEDTLKNKHVLLIDDVMTTGSTLTACTETLLSAEGVKVSVFTLAIAGDITPAIPIVSSKQAGMNH